MSLHLFKYSNSKQASEYLQQKNPEYQDWEVTTLFYSALHLLERYCEVRGFPIPKSHNEREDIVVKWLNDIALEYLSLHSLSINARYESKIKPNQLIDAKAYYSTIESFIMPQI